LVNTVDEESGEGGVSGGLASECQDESLDREGHVGGVRRWVGWVVFGVVLVGRKWEEVFFLVE